MPELRDYLELPPEAASVVPRIVETSGKDHTSSPSRTQARRSELRSVRDEGPLGKRQAAAMAEAGASACRICEGVR
jgi:hypothetical protein